MESYLLPALVLVLIAVVCLVVQLEKRRRSQIEQFTQVNQILAECLQAMNRIHLDGQRQLTELRESIVQLQARVVGASKEGQDASQACSGILLEGMQTSATKICTTLNGVADSVTKTSRESSQELHKDVQSLERNVLRVAERVDKVSERVDDLKAKLMESVKFS